MKKPKPATAGERIARSIWLVEDEDLEVVKIARRIDRSIARAVRKERERWQAIVKVIGDEVHKNPQGFRKGQP